MFIPSRPYCFKLKSDQVPVASDELLIDDINFVFDADVAKQLSGFIFQEDLECMYQHVVDVFNLLVFVGI